MISFAVHWITTKLNVGNYHYQGRPERQSKKTKQKNKRDSEIGNSNKDIKTNTEKNSRLIHNKRPNNNRHLTNMTGGDTKNHRDDVIISKRFKNAVLYCKTFPSANCVSDRRRNIYKLKIKSRILKKIKAVSKRQYNRHE